MVGKYGFRYGSGVLEGPVTAPLCLAILLVAASNDLTRGNLSTGVGVTLAQGIVIGMLTMAAGMGLGARLPTLPPEAKTWLGVGAKASVRLALALSVALALYLWWHG